MFIDALINVHAAPFSPAAAATSRFCVNKLSWNFAVPIYAYKCSACGHAQDVLQKMSDPLLTVCPECGQSTYVKQVTAAGFQLKGSGWYVTDFRDNGAKSSSHAKNSSHSHGEASDGSGADKAKSSDAGSAAAPAPTTDAPAASATSAGDSGSTPAK